MSLIASGAIQKTKISINTIRLPVFIGVFDWEREEKQNVFIKISMDVDISARIASDELQHTLDYSSVIKKIFEKCAHQSFSLIEKLAHSIMEILLSYSQVLCAEISVEKKSPLLECDSVSITLSSEKRTLSNNL